MFFEYFNNFIKDPDHFHVGDSFFLFNSPDNVVLLLKGIQRFMFSIDNNLNERVILQCLGGEFISIIDIDGWSDENSQTKDGKIFDAEGVHCKLLVISYEWIRWYDEI